MSLLGLPCPSLSSSENWHVGACDLSPRVSTRLLGLYIHQVFTYPLRFVQPFGFHLYAVTLQPSGHHPSVARLGDTDNWSPHPSLCLLTLNLKGSGRTSDGFYPLYMKLYGFNAWLTIFAGVLTVVGLMSLCYVSGDRVHKSYIICDIPLIF